MIDQEETKYADLGDYLRANGQNVAYNRISQAHRVSTSKEENGLRVLTIESMSRIIVSDTNQHAFTYVLQPEDVVLAIRVHGTLDILAMLIVNRDGDTEDGLLEHFTQSDMLSIVDHRVYTRSNDLNLQNEVHVEGQTRSHTAVPTPLLQLDWLKVGLTPFAGAVLKPAPKKRPNLSVVPKG